MLITMATRKEYTDLLLLKKNDFINYRAMLLQDGALLIECTNNEFTAQVEMLSELSDSSLSCSPKSSQIECQMRFRGKTDGGGRRDGEEEETGAQR